MSDLAFKHWCETAVEGIRWKPDRARVYDELYAHLEDRRAAMTEAGVPEREAEKQTLAAMGSAAELAEQLRKIHRPFWGYVLRCARILLVIAAVLAVITVPRWLLRLDISRAAPEYRLSIFEDVERYVGDVRSERVFYAEPMAQDASDGYRFTVTRCAQWHFEGTLQDGAAVEDDTLNLEVEVFNLRPWAQNSEVLRGFYAVDSLGNRYGAFDATPHNGKTPMLSGNPWRSGLCTVTWELWLNNYRSQDAEWIELRYDRSGRDVRLRIDLTGGDAA